MQQLHIPRIGETITLSEPWTFTLHEERRNISLIKKVDTQYTGNGWGGWKNGKTWTVTFPAGWELGIDRIYIRQGRSSFDSVTFSCPYNGKKVRFWVKLADANKIVME
jgi:hypothetical protein